MIWLRNAKLLCETWHSFDMICFASLCVKCKGCLVEDVLPSVFGSSADMNGMDPDVVVSTRPFRNVGLSKAAQTHRLRKLRTPAKCRECDSYVYFQGAECEEVRRFPPLPKPLKQKRHSSGGLDVSVVFPGLSQTLPGDAGHPVRPQEAAGPSAALREGILSGGRLRQRRHPFHHHQVHLWDREAGAEDEGENVLAPQLALCLWSLSQKKI